jgi:hypothetical protein
VILPRPSFIKYGRVRSKKSLSNVVASAKAIGKRKAVDKDNFNPMPLSSALRSVNVGGIENLDTHTNTNKYFDDLCHNDANSALVVDTFDSRESDKLAPFVATANLSIFEHRTDDRSDIANGANYSHADLSLDTHYHTPDPYLGYGGNNVDNSSANTIYGEGFINPWLLDQADNHSNLSYETGTGDSASGYIGNGTIDPSLLGGAISKSDNRSPTPSPSQSSLPRASSSPESSYRPLNDTPGQLSPPVRLRALPRRTLRPTVKTDMILTTDLDLSSPSHSDSISEISESEHPAVFTERKKAGPLRWLSTNMRHASARKHRLLMKKHPKAKLPNVSKLGGQRSSTCHHCRASNMYDKMACSADGCQKKFCTKCIEKR